MRLKDAFLCNFARAASAFCRVTRQYFPEFVSWMQGIKDPGRYWLVIFDATGLFHFPERHCPHCLKKVVNKGTPAS